MSSRDGMMMHSSTFRAAFQSVVSPSCVSGTGECGDRGSDTGAAQPSPSFAVDSSLFLFFPDNGRLSPCASLFTCSVLAAGAADSSSFLRSHNLPSRPGSSSSAAARTIDPHLAGDAGARGRQQQERRRGGLPGVVRGVWRRRLRRSQGRARAPPGPRRGESRRGASWTPSVATLSTTSLPRQGTASTAHCYAPRMYARTTVWITIFLIFSLGKT